MAGPIELRVRRGVDAGGPSDRAWVWGQHVPRAGHRDADGGTYISLFSDAIYGTVSGDRCFVIIPDQCF